MIYVLTLVLFVGGELADVKSLPFDNKADCEKAIGHFKARAKADKDIDLFASECMAVQIPKGKAPAPQRGDKGN